MDDCKTIELASLPSVPFAELRLLPHASGVYFACDLEGRVLYVGQTQNLYRRWKVHHRFARLQDMGCMRLAWHLCAFEHLEEIEYAMIQHYNPPLNEDRRAPSSVYTAPVFPRAVHGWTDHESSQSSRRSRPTDPCGTCFYHLAWRVEYPEVFQEPIKSALDHALHTIGIQNAIDILVVDIQPDYLHLFVSFPPTLSAADAVKLLKGISARQLRILFPSIQKRSRSDRLWTPSYFFATAGAGAEQK